VAPGDKVIVVAYAEMEDEEARSHTPRVVLVDGANRSITDARHTTGPSAASAGRPAAYDKGRPEFFGE
jgi:aspartate 1-decarboxylase